jgi:hypothetical protein
VGEPGAGTQVALSPGGGLAAEQVSEEVGIGQLLLRGDLGPRVEDGGGFGEAELLELLAGPRRGDHRLLPTTSYAASGRTSTSPTACWRPRGSGIDDRRQQNFEC